MTGVGEMEDPERTHSADSSRPGRSWVDCKGRRTEAIPKKTLLGSTLEKKDKELVDELNKINLSDTHSQIHKHNLPGSEILDHTAAQLQKQHEQALRAKNMLASLEEKSRYFNKKELLAHAVPDSCSDISLDTKKYEDSKKINCIGLNKAGSYNYDKYGPKPPKHQYSLVGGALEKGMDFTNRETEYGPHSTKAYQGTRHCRRRDLNMNVGAGRGDLHAAPPTTDDLPPNIRHQFGTSVCQSVLSDPTKVAESLEGQKRLQKSLRRTRDVKQVSTLPEDNADPQYEALGNSLRQNVFPGYTYDHHHSHDKSVYTADVHDKRVPDPDEFRYQRDELSTWAEQNVLRERMKKAWDTFLATDK